MAGVRPTSGLADDLGDFLEVVVVRVQVLFVLCTGLRDDDIGPVCIGTTKVSP
jgi:hypothetical protein